jgi:hypothetical protein
MYVLYFSDKGPNKSSSRHNDEDADAADNRSHGNLSMMIMRYLEHTSLMDFTLDDNEEISKLKHATILSSNDLFVHLVLLELTLT